MHEGFVEADTGEKLRIIDSNGNHVGEAFKIFINALVIRRLASPYNNPHAAEIDRWFSEIEERLGILTQDLLEPLEKSFYAGDWGDYLPDEFEFFVKRTHFPVSKWMFDGAVKSASERWTSIDDVMNVVNWLTKIFKEQQLEYSHWYSPQTQLDFEGLYTALKILRERQASKIRIKFDTHMSSHYAE